MISGIRKIAMSAIMIIIVILVVMLVYRLFFEFKKKDVNAYITNEANKYADPVGAAQIIRDGVIHILESYGLTRQIRDVANATGVPKEQVLVNEAEKAAVYYGYLVPATAPQSDGSDQQQENAVY